MGTIDPDRFGALLAGAATGLLLAFAAAGLRPQAFPPETWLIAGAGFGFLAVLLFWRGLDLVVFRWHRPRAKEGSAHKHSKRD
jgi:hypothetical protein